MELILENSKAVVLAGYGAGNLPTNNRKFMDCVEQAIKRDVVVVVKTQCHRGSVNDIYETGKLMTAMGCILALDMTVECIKAKLGYLFGKVIFSLFNDLCRACQSTRSKSSS